VSPSSIPTLTTPRLTLRAIETDDLDGYTAIWSDDEFRRHIGGGPTPSRDAVWHAMAGNIGCWALTGVGPWSVVENATGDLVGRAGLWSEPDWPGIEAVWFLGRPRWGQGYATEAGEASIGYAFDRLDIERVVSVIKPENTRSVQVARRLGMAVASRECLHGADHDVWAISRGAWAARLATS
jgi:RimJ/RimL family protein N-acetyltransferase